MRKEVPVLLISLAFIFVLRELTQQPSGSNTNVLLNYREIEQLEASIALKKKQIEQLQQETYHLLHAQYTFPQPNGNQIITGDQPVKQNTHTLTNGEITNIGGKITMLFKNIQSGNFIKPNDGPSSDWLDLSGTEQTPVYERAFEVYQIDNTYVALKSLKTSKFVRMFPPAQKLSWVIKADGNEYQSLDFHFILHPDGYIQHRTTSAYMNWVVDAGNVLRGHGNAPNKSNAAKKEKSSKFEFIIVTGEQIEQSVISKNQEDLSDEEQDKEYIKIIHSWEKSDEKRIISYGLYGKNPKYTNGAIRNAELVETYFPGWVTRFYVGGDVPADILSKLESLGAEIISIENIKGNIAGMFWRFLVADDPNVDRFIVRDSDSRLNARERFAVEEWINSGKSVHTIRDHVNHRRPLNGGLWGGTKGAIKEMTEMVKNWSNKNNYGADLQFLNQVVWEKIKNDQIGHDAYSCNEFPNSKPFPTKRYNNYQHVGQVFDEFDRPRMDDINRFIRNKEIPMQCRRQPEWKYG